MRRVVPLVAVLLLATSCHGKSADKAATGPTTTATVVVDTTAPPATEPVPETTIARGTPRPATTAVPTAMGPGTARITGTVSGPEGPVTGAVVKVERFVGSEVATADVRTQGGSWSLDSILGGSYRVTIYRPPDLAQATAEVFFLGADETKNLTTNLVRYGENATTATIDPNPPLVGLPSVLVVRFGGGGVDAEGRVVVTPRSGIRVQLSLGPGVGLETAAAVVSDGSGAASWQVRCLVPGPFTATILVANTSSALVVPPCTPAPAAPPP
ncbi:MAG: hypothetical protein QOI99_38 [Actinomycetota bacterium]|nr:hypothetical protein [Actinomycetota bacterium]